MAYAILGAGVFAGGAALGFTAIDTGDQRLLVRAAYMTFAGFLLICAGAVA